MQTARTDLPLLTEEDMFQFFNQFPVAALDDKLDQLRLNIMGRKASTPEQLDFIVALKKLLLQGGPHTASSKSADAIQTTLNFLTTALPTGWIFCTSLSTAHISLVIVLDKYRYKQMEAVQNTVSFITAAQQRLSCTVYTYATMADVLTKGHFYYSVVCLPQYCRFQSQNNYLPITAAQKIPDLCLHTAKLFMKGMHKSTQFREGAHWYTETGETSLATFMLQQACEHCLRALLLCFRGKEIRSHDLGAMQSALLPYIPGIHTAFHEQAKKSAKISLLLQEAYVQARYNANYHISGPALALLTNASERLAHMAYRVFKQQINLLRQVYGL